MKQLSFTIALLLAVAVGVQAQVKTPAASPTSKITQTVGLTEFAIEYSRPSMRGRGVFGDLVPYNEIWRTGANASTKLTFSNDVKINGETLKKGTYALYAIPNKEAWTIIIHKNTTHWGVGNYKQEEDAIRFNVTPTALTETVETFTMNVTNIGVGTADIQISWENTAVAFQVDTDVDTEVQSSIEKTLAGPNMNDYYNAATYYHTTGKDLKQALEWINIAMDKGAKDKFWMVRRKALIEADLGNYKAAIATAKISLELAEKANSGDYVRMNKASIEEWGKK